MIAPLRKAHRRTFAALVVLLPAVFIAGLAMRHPEPVPASVRAQYDRQSSNEAFTAVIRGDGIEVAIAEGWKVADPLLYWSNSRTKNRALPADAKLLGRPGLKLTVTRPGVLILYSGAHRRVVDTMELP
jgi:hypothetical protein